MLGFVAGIVFANAGEWAIHKYILHDRGRDKRSFWSFHFHEHHQACRRNGMVDADYLEPLTGWNAQGKEATLIIAASLAWVPLLPFAPGFASAMLFSHGWYYFIHKKSHLRPEWARRWLPWHYDHHMGPNQDANWCVSWPWFDWVMGTRELYAGTERETADIEKAERRAARRARMQDAA
jgi:sterol desaturase/sphingolipid hydroxylase (fatty acid hydroxylase superfamily)